MNEEQFWNMIEAAWHEAGGYQKERAKLAEGELSEEKLEELMEVLDEVTSALYEQLDTLDAPALLAFDRILERKLYELDRADIQEATDGSDDGFLYARGFIVAMGEDYFNMVISEPSSAVMDAECEEICYISYHIYEEKFGELPPSGISRETGSNKAGWGQ